MTAKKSKAKVSTSVRTSVVKKKASPKQTAKPALTVRETIAHAAPILLIAGDGSIAIEYTHVAASKGYVVHLWNVEPVPAQASLPALAKLVVTPTANASVALEVTTTDRGVKQRNLKTMDSALPPTAPILSSSLTVSATEQATWITGKHRLVGFAALPSYAGKPAAETAPTVFTPRQSLDAVATFLASIGQRMELVQDRVGLVSARIICQLINEAAFALQDDVARPEDIDTAMSLGVKYPHGPFAWAELLGVRNVVAILQALQAEYQEERYRIAPLLKHMALGGEWWHRTTDSTKKEA